MNHCSENGIVINQIESSDSKRIRDKNKNILAFEYPITIIFFFSLSSCLICIWIAWHWNLFHRLRRFLYSATHNIQASGADSCSPVCHFNHGEARNQINVYLKKKTIIKAKIFLHSFSKNPRFRLIKINNNSQ